MKSKKSFSNKPKHAFFILQDGRAIMRHKLEDGSYRVYANALLNSDSVYSRVLKVLHCMSGMRSIQGMRSVKEITRLYCQKYEVSISSNQVAARLSELFTLGLVQRIQNPKDKRVALYSIVASIDPKDNEAMHRLALERLQKIHDFTRMKLCVLAKPPSFTLIE